MSDPWLEQLRQLHEADKARREAQKPKEPEKPPPNRAAALLQKCEAHKWLRQMQKTLLNGGGTLDIFDRAKDYDRLITLAWQGPISEARSLDPDDSEPYSYIMVGVKKEKVWVNDKPLPEITPRALKTALLAAGKNPGREKQRNNK